MKKLFVLIVVSATILNAGGEKYHWRHIPWEGSSLTYMSDAEYKERMARGRAIESDTIAEKHVRAIEKQNSIAKSRDKMFVALALCAGAIGMRLVSENEKVKATAPFVAVPSCFLAASIIMKDDLRQ